MWIRGSLKTLVRLSWRCLEICYPHCWMVPKVAAFFLVDTYQHSALSLFFFFLPKLPLKSTANSACSVLYRFVFFLSTFLGANLYHWPHHSSSRSWVIDFYGENLDSIIFYTPSSSRTQHLRNSDNQRDSKDLTNAYYKSWFVYKTFICTWNQFDDLQVPWQSTFWVSLLNFWGCCFISATEAVVLKLSLPCHGAALHDYDVWVCF